MHFKEFQKALKEDDFALGDSFWLGNFEFEVINRRGAKPGYNENDAVLSLDFLRCGFIDVIKKEHPEIKNADGFFNKYGHKIIRCFTQGVDVFVYHGIIDYIDLIKDAVNETVGQCKKSRSFKACCKASKQTKGTD